MKLRFSLLFFLSGASGLVYQVLWSRKFGEVLGNTHLAISIIVAAFMLGLFAGAWWIGRHPERIRNELRWYAFLEAGIGLFGIIFVMAFGIVQPMFGLLHAGIGQSDFLYSIGSFLLTMLILIVPTAAMGATLPLMVRYFTRTGSGFDQSISLFYMINTLGAATGALVAGFFLIEHAGVNASILIAASLNILVAALALGLVKRASRFPQALGKQSARKAGNGSPDKRIFDRRFYLLIAGLSGFSALALEILWTRSMKFLIHSSTYSFTVVLFIFLLGIATGSFVAYKRMAHLKDPHFIYGLLQLIAGIYVIFTIYLLYRFAQSDAFEENVLNVIYDFSYHWLLGVGTYLLVSLLILFIPTFIMGMLFPMINDLYFRSLKTDPGTAVSRVYAINTLGGILGSLLAGFALIPLLGIKISIACMGLIQFAIGIVFILKAKQKPLQVISIGTLALALAILTAFQGKYLVGRGEGDPDKTRVLFYNEGLMSTVKVFENPAGRAMSIDGRIIAATGSSLLQKERMIAHLPFFTRIGMKEVLSVGLASGISAGSMALHPEVRQIDCVELIRPVFEASREFSKWNHDLHDNSKINLIENDVFAYLRYTDKSYDLISSDGKLGSLNKANTIMLSEDYYELCKSRLNPGGQFIQWVPLITPDKVMDVILQTLANTFEHVSLFYFYPSDVFMIASNEPLALDKIHMDTLFGIAPVKEELSGLGIGKSSALMLGFAGEYRFKQQTDIPVNSFDHPILEFWYMREWKKGGKIPGGYRAANMAFLQKNHQLSQQQATVALQNLGNPFFATGLYNSTQNFLSFCTDNFRNGSYERGLQEFERLKGSVPF